MSDLDREAKRRQFRQTTLPVSIALASVVALVVEAAIVVVWNLR